MALPKFKFIIGGQSRSAPPGDGPQELNEGYVTIFDERTGEEIAVLTFPDGFDASGDVSQSYGETVDFNDKYVVVGTPDFLDLSDRGGVGSSYSAGAVWIYEIGSFELIARREMTDAHLAEYPNSPYAYGNYTPNANFGTSVSVDGDVLVVGAPGQGGGGYDGTRASGRVYQYSLTNIAANPNDKQSYQYTYKGDSGEAIGGNVHVVGGTIAASGQDSSDDFKLRVRLFDSGLDNVRICNRPVGQPWTSLTQVRNIAMSSSKVYLGVPQLYADYISGQLHIFDRTTGNHLGDISPFGPSDDSANWNYYGIEVIYDQVQNKLVVGSPYKGSTGFPVVSTNTQYGAIYIYDSDGSNEIVINGDSNLVNNARGQFGAHIATNGRGQLATPNIDGGISVHNLDGSFYYAVDSYIGLIQDDMTMGWSSPSISLSEVQGYVGGTNPIKLSEYYDSDSIVLPTPTSGPISISSFYNFEDSGY